MRRFLEKPKPEEITTNTINAGVYVLETRVLDLIPPAAVHSIERAFFPALLARGDLVLGPVHRGYWIDIGTPEKYRQVHRDILSGAFPVSLDGEKRAGGYVHRSASVDPGAALKGPFFVGPGCRVEAGAHVGPGAVLVDEGPPGRGGGSRGLRPLDGLHRRSGGPRVRGSSRPGSDGRQERAREGSGARRGHDRHRLLPDRVVMNGERR